MFDRKVRLLSRSDSRTVLIETFELKVSEEGVYLPGGRRVLLAAASGLRASSKQRPDVSSGHRRFVPLTILGSVRRCRRGRRGGGRRVSVGFRFLLGLGFRLLRGAARLLVLVLLFLLLLHGRLVSRRRGRLRGRWRSCTVT